MIDEQKHRCRCIGAVSANRSVCTYVLFACFRHGVPNPMLQSAVRLIRAPHALKFRDAAGVNPHQPVFRVRVLDRLIPGRVHRQLGNF